ncbi:hypothetical protein EVAR_18186_1 [Eumeta japonica]|uniref:Uncharacterized protein n=1 Tax=Eumeta variegata TaxID=151549 RepID=A0A4C1UWJ1_EUMVA|nr:hypothetical protein EVAR_18186_1 [Eumeta japonica]
MRAVARASRYSRFFLSTKNANNSDRSVHDKGLFSGDRISPEGVFRDNTWPALCRVLLTVLPNKKKTLTLFRGRSGSHDNYRSTTAAGPALARSRTTSDRPLRRFELV